jgi:hypothetical protein
MEKTGGADLLGPQAVTVVAVGIHRAVGSQAVLRVEGQGGAFVGRRIAGPVVAQARVGLLVIGIVGFGRSL